MNSIWNRRGFTLVELLVVMGMIALIMAAMTMSISGAQERARIQKATAEVKSVTQAVLAAENFDDSFLERFKTPQDMTASNLKFLLGQAGQMEGGGKIPVFLLAALSADQSLRDPWGEVYRISIQSGRNDGARFSDTKTGVIFPNIWALGRNERVVYRREDIVGGGE